MPGLTGIEVIEALRGWTQVPVLVVSGRSESWDKVEALDAGADDYVTKPFSADELLARIRAMGRRRGGRAGRAGRDVRRRVAADLANHVITRAGEQVRLTPTEWRLLEVLLRNPGRLVTREALLTEVWGPQYTTDTGYIRLYISTAAQEARGDAVEAAALRDRSGDGLPLRGLTGTIKAVPGCCPSRCVWTHRLVRARSKYATTRVAATSAASRMNADPNPRRLLTSAMNRPPSAIPPS